MNPRRKTWLIDALDLQVEAWIPEPGEFPSEEEREETRGLWFDLTCLLRYPEPYYADELIEAVLDIHQAVTGRRMTLHGDTHDDYVWERIYHDMEFAAASCAFRLKEHQWAALPVLDEAPEINYTPQPIVPEKLTYIGVVLKDQDGEPVERSRVRVKLPDGDIREGRTDRDGELMIKGFVLDGIAEIELLDFVEALPDTAAADEEETTAEEVAAAEELLTEEKEFVVKVVDETGKGVSGVSLVFSGAGKSKSVPTDGGGVAKWKAAAESVEVTFESAEAVNKAMKAVWKGRAATAEGDYVPPSSDTVAVVSRAKAIETPDGGMFASVAVEPDAAMTLSVRPAKKRALLIEMHDTLFRNNSAVVNPEGEAPSSTVGEHESITTVGLIATILRYNEEHEGKKLFVAGHTDRAGDEKDNVKLSEDRATTVWALIEGKKAEFVKACKAHYSEVDVTQLMDWTNRQYGFTCKPTTLKENPSDPNYVKFRESFNKWIDEGSAAGEKRGTKIDRYGRVNVQPDLWGAMFDLYEHNLRQELGEDEGGVAQLRSKLVWVDDGNKTIGFGEKHPTATNTVDGMRSQADRRVEVMMFDEGEEPDLTAKRGEDIYDGVTFERKRVETSTQDQEVLVRLCDPTGEPIPFAPFKVDSHGFGAEGTANNEGWATFRVSSGFRSASITWKWTNAPTESDQNQAASLNLRSLAGDDALRQKLSDLGYQVTGRDTAEVLAEFRAEFGRSVEDTELELRDAIDKWHAGAARPARFAHAEGTRHERENVRTK